MMGGVPRRLLVVLATIAVLPACRPSEPDTPVPSFEPSPAVTTGSAVAEASPTPAPRALEGLIPLRLEGPAVAVPLRRFTPMWNDPDPEPTADFLLDTRNPTGQLAPLLVARAATLAGSAWYEVLLPLRPNGSTAWVRATDVALRPRAERIEVDLSRRMLWRYEGDDLVDRVRVGIGTSATPTGTGRFYVWVKVHYANAQGPYGAAALGLSGFSPVLSEWPGEGRMAVHGTANPADRGRAVSHGCVRVFNPELMALLDVPLGTPVLIRA
jgi:lipoprotein-anchoring transpeptidase ErfK/SrfK